jgi:cytochrome c556
MSGCNFIVDQIKKGEYPNYDNSKFMAQSALFNGDVAKIEEVWKQEHKLGEFVDPNNYKSYEELEKLLTNVVGDLGKVEAAAPTPAAKAAAPAAAPAPTEDPEKVFDELTGGDAVAGDAAVDAIFNA